MDHTQDRDPADQLAAAMAVSAYIAHYSPETHGETDTTDDEADATFERAMLEQGVFSPADVIDTLTAHQTGRRVFVLMTTGENFSIHITGKVA